MPDSQINYSFDLFGQTGLQKGLKLFLIQFDLSGQITPNESMIALDHL